MHESNPIDDNTQQPLPRELDHLFARLAPQDVEQFYRSYRLWSLQREITALQTQINVLQQQIEHNARLVQNVQPSPIALSALTRLQAYGIDNGELLDRMLERGDSWLDHTVQLLIRCEELGVIRSDYTQWCENALEGAYDWITSMDQAASTPTTSVPFDETIEATFLQKLMSEDDTDQTGSIVKNSATDTSYQEAVPPADLAEHPPSTAPVPSSTPSPNPDPVPSSTPSPNPATSTIEAGPAIEQHITNDTSTITDFDDFKGPITTQEAALVASPSDCSSKQANPPTLLPATEAPPEAQQVALNEHDQPLLEETPADAIVDQHQASHAVINLETAEDTTRTACTETDNHLHETSAETSDASAHSPALSITNVSSAQETTDLILNHPEYMQQPVNENEEPATAFAAYVLTNKEIAGQANYSLAPSEQSELTTELATTPVQLQEDELALPPVTTTMQRPGISQSSEQTTAKSVQQPEPIQSTTDTSHEPAISWHDEIEELPQVPPEKQPGPLARMFRYFLKGSRKQ